MYGGSGMCPIAAMGSPNLPPSRVHKRTVAAAVEVSVEHFAEQCDAIAFESYVGAWLEFLARMHECVPQRGTPNFQSQIPNFQIANSQSATSRSASSREVTTRGK